MKLVLHVLLVLITLTLVQQGPAMLALAVRLPVQFKVTSSDSVSADLSGLPSGKYYFSAGRVVNEAGAYLDGVPISTGTLTLGAPFEIGLVKRPRQLDIKWSGTSWREQLFDFPVITSYAVGNLLQAWRTFNDVYLGIVSAILMLISALVHGRISRAFSKRMRPHVLVALSCLAYSLVLSGIPDLFFGFGPALAHVILRIAVSAAIIYLLGCYSRKARGTRYLLVTHIPLVLFAVFAAAFSYGWLIPLYRLEILIIGFFTFVSGIWLAKAAPERGSRLLAEFAIAWAILHVVAVSSTWGSGFGSYLSVWTPAFFAVLAFLDLYLISVEAIGFEGEATLARQSVRIAGQVAHDIRSPVAALRTVISHLQISPDEKQLAAMAFERIDGIAREILTMYRGASSPIPQCHRILPVVESLLVEKRVEISDDRQFILESSSDGQTLTGYLEPAQMKRILSNVLNNAISATQSRDKIWIQVQFRGRYTEVVIRDKGSGITGEQLSIIKSERMLNSLSGHGLGLSHAFSYLEAWGGKIDIESVLGSGTTVTLKLRKG